MEQTPNIDEGGARCDRRHALGALGALAILPLGNYGSEAVSAADLTCLVTPAETEGPFFVDERLNRSDLVSTSRSPGVPLALRIGVYEARGSACAPIPGAQVDVWHADAGGAYSDIAEMHTAGKTFLRGYQITDRSGFVSFRTVYPGWYPGRAIHIHFKVRTVASTGKSAVTFTSQLFMPDSISDAVLATPPYNTRGPRDTMNAQDGIYDRSLLLALQRTGAGYAGTFSVGLRIA